MAARYVLTVLHRPAGDGTRTLCALPFEDHELWVPADYRDGDVICWVCEGQYRGCTPLRALEQSAREGLF